jgi:signal transduction histidine kinase
MTGRGAIPGTDRRTSRAVMTVKPLNATAPQVTSEPTLAESARLIKQMRKAHAKLRVLAGKSHARSVDARGETARVQDNLNHLLDLMQATNAKLVESSVNARAMEQAAKVRETDYRRLSNRLLQNQDEERRRLAIDLHDSTAQDLAALIMNLDLIARAACDLDTRSRQVLTESRALADRCSEEVRTLAYLLHPPLLNEMGVVAAIRWYVAGFTERSGIRVNLDLRLNSRPSNPTETVLFRVVQESLGNIHRHANSPTAGIRLTTEGDAVLLEVRDQGGRRAPKPRRRGAAATEAAGVGIRSMRERVDQIGGTFDIDFGIKGSIVRARLPLHGAIR